MSSRAPDDLTRRFLAETSDVATVMLGVDGTIRGWNRGAERLFGYPPDEIVGREGAALFSAEDRAAGAPERELREALHAGRAEDTRWHRRKDGALVRVASVVTPVRDDEGRVLGFGKIVRALTNERDRASSEAQREGERALLERVFELSPSFLSVLRGPDHVYELANPAHLRLIGRRDVLGLPIREALPELADQEIVRLLDRVYRTGEPYVGNEVRIALRSSPDGPIETRHLNFVCQPLRGPDGAVTGILVSGVDVTDLVRSRQEVERALEETQRVAAERDAERRQLVTVLEQAPVAIAITGPAGEILYRNPTFDRLWGRPAHKTRAAEYSDVYEGYHLDGRPVLSHEWSGSRALEGEVVEGDVVEIVQACGRRITVWISGAPVRDEEGRITGAVVMFRDITDERRAEQQLRETQRLHAVGTLAGGVAHEVNNALQGALGFGSLVLRRLGPEHPEARNVRLVLQSAQRAAKVSQQLLAYTRQQHTHPKPVDLRALTEKLRPVLNQLLGADKSLVLPPSQPAPQVLADPGQVEQVLINLVANARDATPTGGRVVIEVEPVRIPEEVAKTARSGPPIAPGRYVCLRVTDTGHGMDAETVARIFDPFFTTKAVGEGSGLGLSMVYGIVKQHGGDVRVRSKPGAGTTMELFWPLAPEAEPLPAVEGTPRVAVAARPGLGRTVLVVDDEPLLRDLIVRVLEDEGYTALAVEDGAAALEVLESGRVRADLVVTDVIMPRLNGRELHVAVRQRWPRLPVLFISGQTGEDVAPERRVPAGAPFLQKPFMPEELARAVADLLRREA